MTAETKKMGKLIKRGTAIEIAEAELDDDRPGDYIIRIGGSMYVNWFNKAEGWEFVPDRPALPTEPGLYEALLYPLDKEFSPYLLDQDGQWSCAGVEDLLTRTRQVGGSQEAMREELLERGWRKLGIEVY